MTIAPTLAIHGDESADVLIEGDRIVSATLGAAAASTLEASGCRVFPGFVDLQCNGGYGVDFTTVPEHADEVAARLPETGVTSFLPTVITAPPDVTLRAIGELGCLRHSSPGPRDRWAFTSRARSSTRVGVELTLDGTSGRQIGPKLHVGSRQEAWRW